MNPKDSKRLSLRTLIRYEYALVADEPPWCWRDAVSRSRSAFSGRLRKCFSFPTLPTFPASAVLVPRLPSSSTARVAGPGHHSLPARPLGVVGDQRKID
jgi:hypothetical protein